MRLPPQQLLQQLVSAATASQGSDEPPELSVYIILPLGVFLGNIAMGICGFGTAILHLSVWVLAQALGYNPGPMPTAVITCSCAMTIGMVPLFFLAKARKHAIKPLAISIPIFKAIAAPFGALVLKLLPARQLEAVVSVLMVMMIVLINKQQLKEAAVRARRYLWPTPTVPVAPECNGQPVKHMQATIADDSTRYTYLAEHHGDGDGAAAAAGDLRSNGHSTAVADAARSNGYLSSEDVVIGSISTQYTTDTDDSSSSDTDEGLEQPLLGAHQQSSDDITVDWLEVDGYEDQASPRRAQGLTQSPAHPEQAGQQAGSFWRLFALGSVTGLCAGVLGGATGISGPPMMIMYAYVQVSKEAVRGTNAVMSLVQDQWIGYYLFGLLRWADAYLYLAAAGAGALGMLIGHSVQKMMDQRHFSVVMSVLMGICFTLMCSAALGWISLASD